MRVYFAGFFDSQKRIKAEADKMWEKGHEVCSTWLYETSRPEGMTTDEFWKKLAIKDLAEINAADLLILDTIDVTPRGGREVELGFALGRFQGKSIYMVGPVRNVFHTLVDRKFDSYEDLMKDIPDITKPSENPKPMNPQQVTKPATALGV